MSTLPFTGRIGAFFVSLAALALIAAACGGGGGGGTPTAETPTGETPAAETPAAGEQQLTAVVVTSDLEVGPNRFAVGIFDEAAGTPVLDAEVHLRFLKVLEGDQAELRFEAEPEFVGFESFFINEETGEKQVTGDTGVYITSVEFDEAGDWGVEATGTLDGQEFGPLRTGFQVLEAGQALSVGDPAPRSRQAIASDVEDIREIDSMVPPDPMHDITVAGAIDSGKPVVVLFGTPAFCETRTCGPVMETVMLALHDKYKDQAIFVHVEPYFLDELRTGKGLCAVPVFNLELARQGLGEGPGPCPTLSPDQLPPPSESWNLTTEPIIFVIGREGIIAGKFEGIVGPQEVEDALKQVL